MKSSEIFVKNEFDYLLCNRERDAFEDIIERLSSDGIPQRNLSTFSNTDIDNHTSELVRITLGKNAVIKSNYNEISLIEDECVQEISKLWNVENCDDYYGTSTVGSSEACLMAALAMKSLWEEKVSNSMDISNRRPNIVISSAMHICWVKIAKMFNLELRCISLNDHDYSVDLEKVYASLDDNTIGLVAILGSTYTGSYDNVEALDSIIEKYNSVNNTSIPIHVDAASGGLYTPFVEPELKWDFRLKNVISINASGHKYGLASICVGWILWRSKKYIVNDLVNDVNYTGGLLKHCGFNFSKPSSPIVVQYYRFKSLGYDGFKSVHTQLKDLANYMISEIKEIHELSLIISSENSLPVVCWKLSEPEEQGWNLYNLGDLLKEKGGWHIATYRLPENMFDTIVQRFVCRTDFSYDLAKKFVSNLKEAISILNEKYNNKQYELFSELTELI